MQLVNSGGLNMFNYIPKNWLKSSFLESLALLDSFLYPTGNELSGSRNWKWNILINDYFWFPEEEKKKEEKNAICCWNITLESFYSTKFKNATIKHRNPSGGHTCLNYKAKVKPVFPCSLHCGSSCSLCTSLWNYLGFIIFVSSRNFGHLKRSHEKDKQVFSF